MTATRINKRRREAESAIDLLLTAVITIYCSRCNEHDAMQAPTCDANEAAVYFYDEGWRVVDDRLLCKRCRRKR